MADNTKLKQIQTGFRDVGLPLLALIEAAATEGRSPGTISLGVQQQQLQKAAQDEQQSRQDALSKQLLGFKQAGETRAVAGEGRAQKTFESKQSEADRAARQRKLLGEADISRVDFSPEEQVFVGIGDLPTALSLVSKRKRAEASAMSRGGIAEAAEQRKISREERAEQRKIDREQRKEQQSIAKLTGPEKQKLGAIGGAVNDLNTITDMFNTGEFTNIGSAFKGVVSKVPIFGQRIAPDEAGFMKFKRITAERFLREATGAAAPEHEVKTYTSFLPQLGDTPQQAQAALDSFIGAVKAKALSAVSRLEAEGNAQKAAQIKQNIESQLSQIKAINVSASPQGQPAPAESPAITELKNRARAGDAEAQEGLRGLGITF